MKMQIAVFFGGRSVEHEVSIITGMQAIAALDKGKYEPLPVYVTKDGSLYTGEDFHYLEPYKDISALLEKGRQINFYRSGGRVCMQPIAKRLFGSDKPVFIDAALPLMHGTFGEDGCLQGLLEMLGLPYAGSDVLSSALCMDKAASKALLRAAGLPALDDAVLQADSFHGSTEAVLSAIESRYAYPVVVKPVNLGSSVGVTKAECREKLNAALGMAFGFSERVIIEPALVHMREINCSVLGDAQNARASICEEPVARDDILSYTDKYQSGKGVKQDGLSGQKRIIPADLSPGKTAEAQKLAVSAFSTLGCGGVARVDLMCDTLHDKFYINEINTIPGSLSFYLWEKSGLGFSGLLDEMITLAFSRARRRAGLTYTYETNILSEASWKSSKGKA
ncbi:MAG: D-alanine--D-alanine ligase [Oscillospiraceae bacterium]|nr:D-alanine--D-alanine ligase [Oscillospiraceae bacterium]